MRKLPTKDFLVRDVDNERKTLEVRLNDERVQDIKPGEQICMVSRSNGVVVHVKRRTPYATIDALLDEEEARRIAPGFDSDGVKRGLEGLYPPDLIKRYGWVVFEIKRVRAAVKRELES